MISLACLWICLVATLLASFVLRRRSLSLRLAIELVAIAVTSAFLIPLVGSTLHPVFPVDASSAESSQRIFVAFWWLLAARLVVLGGRIGFNLNEHASRLVFDLVSAAIHIGAVLIVLYLAFGISVTSLVATSGIIAIVVGLALQSTLGDLFSGIAISIEQPFGIGDYIWLEGSIEGVVIETNWRATRIVTDSNDIATVPNSVVAKARIMNRSRPTEVRTETIRIVLDPAILPHRGIELIKSALLTTSGVAPHPEGGVFCNELRGEGTAYHIVFAAPRGNLGSVRSELLHNVARHTRFAGVALAMQNNVPLTRIARPDGYQLLCETDLFASLTEAERQTLASELVVRRGIKGEFLFEQGGSQASLFVVSQGVFDVIVDSGNGPRHLGRLAPGDCVGEMSLLVGAANQASVKASTSFFVYEMTKESLASLMRDNPEVLHAIEAGAARAQDRLDRILASYETTDHDTAPHLISRIRSFFDLPG